MLLFAFALLTSSLPAFAGTINLPQTGQTTSYATGDDGNLQKGVAWPSPRFTNNGNSTVTDNLTGLIWTQDANAPGPVACSPGVVKTWQGALDYVACLNANSYLGYTDWRLPNVNELESMVNAGQSSSAAWLNAQGFSSVQASYYWSATTYAGLTDNAWNVNLGDGSVSYYYKTTSYYVWAVRGGVADTTPPTGFISINSGAAYTNSTSVALTLSCADSSGCSEMQFSNDNLTYSVAEAYAATKVWTLPAGDGTKTVYVKYKDYAGNWSTATISDTIVLDTTVLTTTASPVGGTYSAAQSVTLTPNESATTYYCTGESCMPATVYSSAINVSSSTTLRFYSKDAANNSESIKTERYSISPPSGLSYTGQDTGGGGMDSKGGVTRSDFEGGDIEGSDAENLDSGKARFDLLYNFTVLLVDDTGESPQLQPKLYVAHKISPSSGDFFKYDLTCTGLTWAGGKTCTIAMPLGPAAAGKYYFTGTKTTGGVVRLPSSGYLDGPTVKTLDGWAIVSAARDIDAATLSAATALGNSTALEWVSTGLDAVYNSVFNGYWQTPSSIKKGKAYFINGGSGTLPELAGYSDASAANVEITLQQGWNLIATPYNGNVKLSNVFVRKGAGADQTWTTAASSNWVYNTLWNFNGSGWGNTYRSDSAGGSPDAVLAPWMGYWIYLRVNDDTYTLVIPKPAQ